MQLNAPWRFAVICAALAVQLSACRPAGQQTDAGAPMFTDNHGLLTVPTNSPMRSRLSLQPAQGGGGAATLDLPAVVETDPARVVNIVAPLTGRVVALKVALGEHVRQGQVLAILSSGDFAQARADVQKARDGFELAQKALARARGVEAAGGAAGKDIESAQSAYNQAEAEQTRANTRLQSLSGNTSGSQLTLTAPQSGIVTSLAIAAGAQVDDPTAVLMTVTNLDRLFVTANVAEADIGKVVVGEAANIVLTSDPTHPFSGKIAQVNAVIDPDTRRQKVRIAMANPEGRLLPNMYATVHLSAPSVGGVFVPQSALLMNNDAISVLVEVRPWVFQRQTVQIGDETDTGARVLSGLKAGDRVVVRGGVLFND